MFENLSEKLQRAFKNLRQVGLGVPLDFFRTQRRTRRRAPRWVANHTREVADQENDGVAQILKVLQLAHQHGVPEV